MSKKNKVVFIVLAAVCLMIIVKGIIYLQVQKDYIKESYYRQNVAFTIVYPDYKEEGCEVYHSYEDVLSLQYLYAYLCLYEHDTGHTVTLDDVWEYLSNEYNEDGTRRLSEQYPEIQGYIDFFWDSLKSYPKDNSYETDYISLYIISIRDGLMILNDIHDIWEYRIWYFSLSDMDKAIEWAFNVSDEQKAEGYIFNTYDLSRGKTDLGTVEK